MRYPFKGSIRITQYFGETPASYAQFGLKGHNGIDFGAPTGTEILATHDGKVIEAINDATGYGLYVKIENDKEGSLYAHLREHKVVVGQDVKEGALLGISDNTGNSTGSHLHFGYYLKPRDRANGYAGYIDPMSYLTQVEPIATITQKELDKIRLDRDTHYNDLQTANKRIEQLEKDIDNLENTIEQKDKKILELETQIAASRTVTLEVPRETSTAPSTPTTTVSTMPAGAPVWPEEEETPPQQSQTDPFTTFLRWIESLFKK